MNYNFWLTLLLIFTKKEEEEILYIPYYSVFDIKEEPDDMHLKKKNSYYTTACKSYDAVKQHGIDLLK